MKKHILQPCIWPEELEEEQLYIRTNGSIRRSSMGTAVVLKKGEYCRFDTYFNAFSSGKWKKYSRVEEFQLELTVSGAVCARLFNSRLDGERNLLLQQDSDGIEKRTITLSAFSVQPESIIYMELEALGEQVEFYDFAYFAVIPEEQIWDIHLSSVICTYKRERYVEENLRRLEERILSNESSPLYDRLSVFVADNGQTLDLKTMPQIQIKKNKNLGGVGGFTRGMIETLETMPKATHILLMDDDAIIRPHVLERTYRFLSVLRPEFQEHTIAGALLRQDMPWIQFESGAQWNRGKIKALKNQLNLTEIANVLVNESEKEEIEYAGWWYSCMPVSMIKKVGLPLPLFIHRDDIEYGLRLNKKFITLNGIGIWHEPYLNKMPGVMEYYDIRNLAIVNVIHYDDYRLKELLMTYWKWTMGNIIRLCYRYVSYNTKGILDFCRGGSWLENVDAEALNRTLVEQNYRLLDQTTVYEQFSIHASTVPVSEQRLDGKLDHKCWKIITFNGAIFPALKEKPIVVRPYCNIYDLYRRREVIYVDTAKKCFYTKRRVGLAIRCLVDIVLASKNVILGFTKMKGDYKEHYQNLISIRYWRKNLDL